jgi:hypothetical protein
MLQVERVEAFSEPAIDRSEKIAGLLPFALITPQPPAPCLSQRAIHRPSSVWPLVRLFGRLGENTIPAGKTHRLPPKQHFRTDLRSAATTEDRNIFA